MSLLDYFKSPKQSDMSVVDILTSLVLRHRVPIDEFNRIIKIVDEDQCKRELLRLARRYRVNIKDIVRARNN